VSEAVISCQVNATGTRDLRSFKRARPVRLCLRPLPLAPNHHARSIATLATTLVE
jgi:hypothetical protein